MQSYGCGLYVARLPSCNAAVPEWDILPILMVDQLAQRSDFCKRVPPRDADAMSGAVSYRYMMQVLKLYNGTSKKNVLSVKF